MTSRTRLLSASTALVTLGACAATSVRDMREREPVLAADSRRSVAEISECVSTAWIDAKATPKLVPRAGGASLVNEAGSPLNIVYAALDMDRQVSGTHVELRIFKTLWTRQNRKRVEEVRACL